MYQAGAVRLGVKTHGAAPSFDAKWKTINLGAAVPGRARFQAAQEWLEREARKPPNRQ